MNLNRPGTAVDIERLGKLGRNALRPYMKNVARVVLSAAR
jgi:hypothetical protein